MKILRETGPYLKNKAQYSLLLAIFCAVVFAMLSLSYLRSLPLYIDLGEYEIIRGGVYALPAVMAVYWWRQYRKYNRGYEGEKNVTKLLKSALSDDFHLINDVTFNGYNIDHIVLSPRGIFAIETKNHKGKISKNTLLFASYQAQKNAKRVKKIVDSLEPIKERMWVEPVVVFPNYDVEFDPYETEAKVTKFHELPY